MKIPKTTTAELYVCCQINSKTLKLKAYDTTSQYFPIKNNWDSWENYDHEGNCLFFVLPKDINKMYLKYLKTRWKNLAKQIQKLEETQRKITNKIIELEPNLTNNANTIDTMRGV